MRKLIITFMMMALMVVGLPLALPTETRRNKASGIKSTGIREVVFATDV